MCKFSREIELEVCPVLLELMNENNVSSPI
jgi:hypothetical protein